MSDFFQTGVVATLHRLKETGHERLERELMEFSEQRPVGLVLPALYSEFEGDALPPDSRTPQGSEIPSPGHHHAGPRG